MNGLRNRCRECPTIEDCREAFGRWWAEKSRGGRGCNNPFSYARPRKTRGNAPASPPRGADAPGGEFPALAVPPPKMPRRPVRPAVKKIQSGAPARPKVSAEIMRQADLFFGRVK